MTFHHNLWSQGSRRTGGTPSGDVPFAPKRWPLKPRAKVPSEDPSDRIDDVNPALDKSRSGGSSSGTAGRGRGKNGRDIGTGIVAQDVTVPVDPRKGKRKKRRNPYHHDDGSEPRQISREELERRHGQTSNRRSKPRNRLPRRLRQPMPNWQEMAIEPEETEPPAPAGPSASVHTAAGIHMDDFAPPTFAGRDQTEPNLPGLKPLRYVTPAKRSRAGLGQARSRKLPGSYPVTGPLPDAQHRGGDV